MSEPWYIIDDNTGLLGCVRRDEIDAEIQQYIADEIESSAEFLSMDTVVSSPYRRVLLNALEGGEDAFKNEDFFITVYELDDTMARQWNAYVTKRGYDAYTLCMERKSSIERVCRLPLSARREMMSLAEFLLRYGEKEREMYMPDIIVQDKGIRAMLTGSPDA